MSESEAAGASAPGVNPASLSITLAGASREKADAFLDKQAAFTDQLMEELQEENPLKLACLRARRFSGYARVGLEISIGLLVLALVAGIGLMVWNAAHSEGLVIESFSVPPELAARGLNGQVIAGQVLDRVTVMNAVRSNRAAQSYANNWGNDLKVEIPETGMSVGELYRFLKSWLGKETHVTGEVWRTENGIAITARVTGGSGATVTGAAADFPALLQRAAESVYAQTQPYRYAVYLTANGRTEESLARYRYLALNSPNATDRGWAYLGWGNSINEREPVREVVRVLRQSLSYGVAGSINNLAVAERDAGLHELSLTHLRRSNELSRKGSNGQNPLFAAANRSASDARLSAALGAFHDASRQMQIANNQGYVGVGGRTFALASMQIGAHDLAGARASILLPNPNVGFNRAFTRVLLQLERPRSEMEMAWALEDWATAIARARTVTAIAAQAPGLLSRLPATVHPQLAYARAKLGDMAGAGRLIASPPADCYPCLIQRARIAELRGQKARADGWFARAVAIGPSLPFAHAEWGKILLERGQPDAAIEKFSLANRTGSHFADPLEGWGEALMAKNQSHRALAKFAEANKYAPNWGRLHLKWGQALAYSGKRAEAAKHFARAAALDLTPAEKSELVRYS